MAASFWATLAIGENAGDGDIGEVAVLAFVGGDAIVEWMYVARMPMVKRELRLVTGFIGQQRGSCR